MGGKAARPGRRWFGRKRPDAEPELVLCGAGFGDGLHLSVQAQRTILAAGEAFTIGVPVVLIDHLRASRVRVTDLNPLVEDADDYQTGYLAVVDEVLKKVETAPPAVLVSAGNPFFMNSISRFLAQLAQERDIRLNVLPASSAVDALVNDLGLDVASRGLQIFDARQLVARQLVINPQVPLFLFGVDAFADPRLLPPGVPPEDLLAHLGTYLEKTFGSDRPVTLVARMTGMGRMEQMTVPLSRAAELWPIGGPWRGPLRGTGAVTRASGIRRPIERKDQRHANHRR